MFKKVLLGLFTVLLIVGGSNMADAKTWDKTFPKSDKVNLKTDSGLHLLEIYMFQKQ